MKYRSKPVVIEAIQLTRESFYNCIKFIDTEKIGKFYSEKCCIDIVTAEGALTASDGDWIIKGTEGEFYPCKDVVFKKKYEPVFSQDEQ